LLINPDKHYFFEISADIDELIQPLKTHFGLTSLAYQQSFIDGSEIRFSNQAEWTRHYYEQELYKYSMFEIDPRQFKKDRILWAGLTGHQTILEQARAFNIDHGITFVEPGSEGCEFFFLGTTRDRSQVMSKYLSHIELEEMFYDAKGKSRCCAYN